MCVGDVGFDCRGFRGSGFNGAPGAAEEVNFPGCIETQVIEIDRADAQRLAGEMGMQVSGISRSAGQGAAPLLSQVRSGGAQPRLRGPYVRAILQCRCDQLGELGIIQGGPPCGDGWRGRYYVFRRPIERGCVRSIRRYRGRAAIIGAHRAAAECRGAQHRKYKGSNPNAGVQHRSKPQ